MEKLLYWQKICLFIAVVLFPIQSLLIYKNSLLSLFSFNAQISSIPFLIGLVLAFVGIVKEGEVKKILLPAAIFGVFYVVLCMGISLHSIFEYAAVGEFTPEIFGSGGPKTQLAKSILLCLGIESDAVLYGLLIFTRETKTAVVECVFAFGFVFWLAYLFRKEGQAIFETVRKAVIWSIVLLTPYVILEVLHLYGVDGATSTLKAINPMLYEPGRYLGWYPPIVSPYQVRGTFTEPSYFAFWLAFSVPFIVCSVFKEKVISVKKFCIAFVFFTFLFSVWFITYARTSIVLMAVLVSLYAFFAIFVRSVTNWQKLCLLLVSVLFAFCITSSFGPQEISQQSSPLMTSSQSSPLMTSSISNNRHLSDSALFRNTVKSSVDSESRSNPVRIEDFFFKIEIFKDHPIAGAGDTLLSYAQMKKMQNTSLKLTREARHRLAYTKINGLLLTGISNNPFSFAGTLAGRGILGFSVIFVPIFLLGISLLVYIFKTEGRNRQTGITLFVSSVALFLAVFTMGLKTFCFWCDAGLVLGLLVGTENIVKQKFLSLLKSKYL